MAPNDMTGGPAVGALLAPATFTPIYRDGLDARDAQLAERLGTMALGRAQRILLVNATLGLQFYPSIVDFFVILQRVQPGVQVTATSYFGYVHQFGDEVARKGLTVLPVATVECWPADEINRYDIVLAIGPSDTLAHFMATPGLTAKLVLLDLAFYHQLIESTREAFLCLSDPSRWEAWTEAHHPEGTSPEVYGRAWVADLAVRVARQQHPVTCYSCQPRAKIKSDIARFYNLDRFAWRWFGYIPLGFRYGPYYRSDRHVFDVALLGSAGRDYSELDPAVLRGLRFLFVGAEERAPEIARLRASLDITVVPRVDEDTYARLLALCRCALLPVAPAANNVLLSVVDTFASGTVLVTQRRDGLERLARAGAPIAFYKDRADLSARLGDLLHNEALRQDLSVRAVAFAQAHLDIYGILETLVRDNLLRDPVA